jgi:STE24 endopeptidase
MVGDDDRARRYHRLQFWLGVVGLGAGVLYLVAMLVTGAGRAVDDVAARVSGALAWRVAVVALVLGAGERVLTFPLGWVRGWWLPRRYGLLHQPLAAWLGDRLKAALIGGVLGLVTLEVIYLLIAATPWWWLAAAAVLLAVQVLVAFVFPVWLVPLFYRLVPLADEGLRQRLLALARRAGVSVVGVWVADQSRKSRTANAALAGLGRTRRIILFDTLVDQFAPAEIEAVLAHELAHHVHRDIRRGLALQALLTLFALGVADVALRRGASPWGLDGPADPAGVPWLGLVMIAIGAVTAPLASAFSRRLERQADDFALATTGDLAGFVAAMERLASLNLAERRPHRLKEILLYSHPSIDRRIARAQARSATAALASATSAVSPSASRP